MNSASAGAEVPLVLEEALNPPLSREIRAKTRCSALVDPRRPGGLPPHAALRGPRKAPPRPACKAKVRT